MTFTIHFTYNYHFKWIDHDALAPPPLLQMLAVYTFHIFMNQGVIYGSDAYWYSPKKRCEYLKWGLIPITNVTVYKYMYTSFLMFPLLRVRTCKAGSVTCFNGLPTALHTEAAHNKCHWNHVCEGQCTSMGKTASPKHPSGTTSLSS